MNIVIIDFGAGNIYSLYNVLIRYFPKASIKIFEKEDDLRVASHIIMPGVGAFDKAMINIHKNKGLVEYLNYYVNEKQKNFLGICVGMQILANYGYENQKTAGLGWISGNILPLEENISDNCKIPHMGWNNIKILQDNIRFRKIDQKDFYFVHSFFFSTKESNVVVANSNYDINIPCLLVKDNIVATQFHPEKSGESGIKFLEIFLSN